MIVFGSRRLVDQGTIFTFPSVCLALFPRKVVAKVASGAVNIRSPFILLHACFATFTGTRVACVGLAFFLIQKKTLLTCATMIVLGSRRQVGQLAVFTFPTVCRQRRALEFEAAVLPVVIVGRKHADQGLARTARMVPCCVPLVYPT